MPAIPETTIGWTCSRCGTVQRVYVGDQSDCTAPEVEAIRCLACKNLDLIAGTLEFRSRHSLFDEDDNDLPITQEVMAECAYIEDGIMDKTQPVADPQACIDGHNQYAICRFDEWSEEISGLDPTQRFRVKRVVADLKTAEAEVERLNKLNGQKGVKYFWQTTWVDG